MQKVLAYINVCFYIHRQSLGSKTYQSFQISCGCLKSLDGTVWLCFDHECYSHSKKKKGKKKKKKLTLNEQRQLSTCTVPPWLTMHFTIQWCHYIHQQSGIGIRILWPISFSTCEILKRPLYCVEQVFTSKILGCRSGPWTNWQKLTI